MDQSDEHIDIVGDDTEMECRDEEETIPEPQPTEDNKDYDIAEQSSEEHHHLSIVPLTVQITPDSEPLGAKKRKIEVIEMQEHRSVVEHGRDAVVKNLSERYRKF